MLYGIGQYIADNSTGQFEKINLIGGEYIPVNSVEKLGVQAQPGSEFSISGMPIKVGRTGSYEILFNHVSITDLQLISKDIYIIDYKYLLNS